jgi:hypothetical protein
VVVTLIDAIAHPNSPVLCGCGGACWPGHTAGRRAAEDRAGLSQVARSRAATDHAHGISAADDTGMLHLHAC